jgi:RecB family exonuclease
VDASRLFQNLSDLKEIDERFDYLSDDQKEVIRSFWGNARLEKSAPLKNGFLNFWQELGQVYTIFRQNLQNRQLAYEGMIYDEVARKIKNGESISLPYEAYCFAGFNALNECEKNLFDFFRKSGKAYFFWDYDDYYISNTWHEAGLFLRENIKRYPSPEFTSETSFFESGKKNITIIAANNDVAQAKILPEIIEKEAPGLKTCVVLSDESLLTPVLSSLPDSIERVNITMGYPFSNSPAFTLLELVIKLLRAARKDQEHGKLYYFKEVLALLRHPYMQQISPDETSALIHTIATENRIYIHPGELEDVPAIHNLLNVLDDEIPDRFAIFLQEIASQLDVIPTTDPLDIQYLLSLYSQTNKLSNLIKEENIDIPAVARMRFLRQLARRIKVSFIGEPLTDFQVLGVLETRLLDFEHVIMLSVNEGILPAKEQGNSFIPYNLRKALGMPTIEYHDSIYAYYFYRFIQRADKITMVYNAKSGSLQSGEMSRYLYQLKYDPHFIINEKALTFQISIPSENAIVIKKEGKIAQLLIQFAQKHTFTPTSLNTWLSCSLKFNFQFLEGLKEKEEVTEDVDASQFGKLLHHAMYHLYKPYEGKLIKAEDIQYLRKNAKTEEALNTAFENLYPSRGNQNWKLSGKNLIIKEIIQKYISKILEVDEAYAPFTLIAIEKKIEKQVQVKTVDFPVKIGGYVDRIDYKDGIYRIIDYKTGEAYPNFSDVRSLFSGEKRKMKDAALQCLIYAYVLMEAYPEGAIQAGLYSVRKMFDKEYNYQLRITKGDTISDIRIFKEEIIEQLEEVLNTLLDPEIAFTKTEELQSCIHCSYKSICHREGGLMIEKVTLFNYF